MNSRLVRFLLPLMCLLSLAPAPAAEAPQSPPAVEMAARRWVNEVIGSGDRASVEALAEPGLVAEVYPANGGGALRLEGIRPWQERLPEKGPMHLEILEVVASGHRAAVLLRFEDARGHARVGSVWLALGPDGRISHTVQTFDLVSEGGPSATRDQLIYRQDPTREGAGEGPKNPRSAGKNAAGRTKPSFEVH